VEVAAEVTGRGVTGAVNLGTLLVTATNPQIVAIIAMSTVTSPESVLMNRWNLAVATNVVSLAI